MKMRIPVSHLLITVVAALSVATASAFDRKDYKAYADGVRRQVWAQELPEFQHPATTDRFANRSAVILAAYDEFCVTKRNKFSFFSNTGSLPELTCNVLSRQMVQINDETALQEYSEFDFLAYASRRMPYYGKMEVRRVLGVRIIKPDGSVSEVSTDDYVSADEGRKGRDERQKLPVPGLAIGDIIDVFTYRFSRMKDINPEPRYFSFVDEYPMLSYRVHCEIDDNLTAQYRTLNGAPDFEVTTNDDGDHVLDVRVTDVEKTLPGLWYKPAMQTPMTMLFVQIMPTEALGKALGSRACLAANPEASMVQARDWEYWQSNRNYYAVGKDSKRIIKEAAQRYSTQEQLADYLYDRCSAYRLSNRLGQSSPAEFILWLAKNFTTAGISYQCGMTTAVDREPIDQLAFYGHTTWFLRLPSGRYYFFPTFAARAGEVPSELQGRRAIICTNGKGKLTAGPYEQIVLPQSTAADNVVQTTIEATIDDSRLSISRSQQMSGTVREAVSLILPTRAQLVESKMRVYDPDFTRGQLYHGKEDNLVAEQEQKDLESQKEQFVLDAKGYHGQAPAGEVEGQLITVGSTDAEPLLTYRMTYAMDGMVKRAGTNLILALGKLLGDVLKLEGQARERTDDVWREAPSSYRWDITVALPEGYSVTAEQLAPFRTDCTTAAGHFRAEATVADGRLHLTAERTFDHKVEPAANWPQILEIYDRMSDYTAQQIVLRK